MTHTVLEVPDVPGDARTDAGLGGRDSGSDARLDARRSDTGDSGACRFVWGSPNRIEPDPRVHFDLAARTAETPGYDAVYQNANPVACDGTCPVFTRIDDTATSGSIAPLYWAHDPDITGFVARGLWLEQGNATPLVIVQDDTQVRVAFRADEAWNPGGTFRTQPLGDEERLIGIAMDGYLRDVWLAWASPDLRAGRDGWFVSLRMQSIMGRTWLPRFPQPYRALDLRTVPGDLLVGGVGDGPRAVQIDGVQTTSGPSHTWWPETEGCEEDAFAMDQASGGAIQVALGCQRADVRGQVRLRQLWPDGSSSRPIADDRFTDDISPMAIATDGSTVIVAYWGADEGSLELVAASQVSGAVVARGRVPDAQFAWAETFPGQLELASAARDEFAVMWTASWQGGIQRFRVECGSD